MRTAGFCPPLIETSPTPAYLRNLLCQLRVGEVLYLVERQRVRSQRQRKNRRVRGVDFAVDRRVRQVRAADRFPRN